MFESRIRNAHSTGIEITVFTHFGWARGKVIECHEGWFTFSRKIDGTRISIYYQDVMLLEEHGV
jgi:hypothetical protein